MSTLSFDSFHAFIPTFLPILHAIEYKHDFIVASLSFYVAAILLSEYKRRECVFFSCYDIHLSDITCNVLIQ